MRFSIVTFVTSLALFGGLYAAPIGETVENSIIRSISRNENASSGTLTNEAPVAVTCSSNNDLDDSDDEPILTRIKKHADKQQSSNKISFQCYWENCNQEFDNVAGLSKHIDKNHFVKGQKYYQCKWESCNLFCKYISELQRHLRTHTKERPFACRYDGCGQSFARNSYLKKHIRTHHLSEKESSTPLEQECESLELDKNTVLHCDWKNCNSEFNDVTLLINHIEEDHIGSGVSYYECQWKDCRYNAKNRNHVSYHIRSKHAKYRPFICSYNNCGQTFSQKENLVRHINCIHSSKYAFPCPLLQCDKKYSRIDAVRKHLFSHAVASNYSFSDVDSIWNAFNKKIPYPVDILSRISLKERVVEENTQESNIDRMNELMNESNEKQTERNADYSETSTNVIEGNNSFMESNSEQEYNTEQLNNGKVQQQALILNYVNDETVLATGITKRPLQSDEEFSRKRVSIFELIN